MSGFGKVVVIGMGRTGLSAVRHLAGRARELIVVDSRDAPPCLADIRGSFPGVRAHTGDMRPDWFAGCDFVVVSPGFRVDADFCAFIGVDRTRVIGDVELFALQNDRPVIAITGSNGKSTVTAMTAYALNALGNDAVAGGNIGVPVLDLAGRPASTFVLELSSFQLESTFTLAPDAAVVLNLSEDHLDWYAGMADYLKAKLRIYQRARVAIVNRDDPRLADFRPASGRAVTVGTGAPPTAADYGMVDKGGRRWLVRGEHRLMAVADLPLAGGHNAFNALATIALVEALTGPLTDPAGILGGFRGLPHRFETVADVAGVIWVNDSKATNTGATLAALEGVDRPVILLAGGQGKGADFSVLREAVSKHVRLLILFGEDAGRLDGALGDCVETARVGDLAAAVALAARRCSSGDMVLLSPACASFDQFRNYEVRGDAFRALAGAVGA